MRRRWALAAGAAAVLLGAAAVTAAVRAGKPAPGLRGDGVRGPAGMVWVPGGRFVMGSGSKLARPNEQPAFDASVDGFWMDQTDVTNAEFAAFVRATAYVTTAEREPEAVALRAQLPAGARLPDGALPAASMVFVGADATVALNDWSRWWRLVAGANWRHPQGPHSGIAGKQEHPVVQVSYEDAIAYARWSGKRLPSEAEWEFAARGGLSQADYAWGNQPAPQGRRMANTFARPGSFPVVASSYRTQVGTSPVRSFPPNGYGLYDMTGNVWQWVADWYRADQFRRVPRNGVLHNPPGPQASYDPDDASAPADAPRRVIRGGSFLCDPSYCASYRPSARRGNDPDNPMSHIGFRLVMSNEDWRRQARR